MSRGSARSLAAEVYLQLVPVVRSFPRSRRCWKGSPAPGERRPRDGRLPEKYVLLGNKSPVHPWALLPSKDARIGAEPKAAHEEARPDPDPSSAAGCLRGGGGGSGGGSSSRRAHFRLPSRMAGQRRCRPEGLLYRARFWLPLLLLPLPHRPLAFLAISNSSPFGGPRGLLLTQHWLQSGDYTGSSQSILLQVESGEFPSPKTDYLPGTDLQDRELRASTPAPQM